MDRNNFPHYNRKYHAEAWTKGLHKITFGASFGGGRRSTAGGGAKSKMYARCSMMILTRRLIACISYREEKVREKKKKNLTQSSNHSQLPLHTRAAVNGSTLGFSNSGDHNASGPILIVQEERVN